MADFKTFFTEKRKLIDSFINNTLVKRIKKDLEIGGGKVRKVGQVYADGMLDGKRIRASLVYLGYYLLKNNTPKDLVYPATAFEIFQTSILAHDDIADNAPLRRGKPTIYYALGKDHLALSNTTFVADYGFFLAQELALQGNFPLKEKISAASAFNKACLNTNVGQILDMQLSLVFKSVTEKDVLTVLEWKTAWYTVVGPLYTGASLAGADKKLLDSIVKFGTHLGMAFQIQDDYIGIFGSVKEIGKSNTSDIEEGKATLFIKHALKNASAQDKAFIFKHYGKGKINAQNFKKLKEILVRTGSVEFAKKNAKLHAQKAKQLIPAIAKNKAAIPVLEGFVSYLIERSS